MKRYYYIIIIVVAFLFTVVLARVQKETPPPDAGSLIIKWADGESVIKADDLGSLKQDELKHNGTTFSGFLLNAVLLKTIPSLDGYTEIRFYARDGFQSSVDFAELKKPVYLIYAEFDKKEVRPSKKQIGIAFPEDTFRNRWVKDLYKIELVK